jgi:phosphatidylethanolamine-binding protein (PEBP) family uncharacterized protein
MVTFTVEYGQTNSNGKTLSKKNTVNPPFMKFKGDPGKVYTLLMSDPDAAAKSWLHWLITNIPGEANEIAEGQVLVNYAGPSPPSGTHRYIFTIYEQRGASLMVSPPSDRGNFDVKGFEQRLGLHPVASRTVRVPAK